MTHKDIKNHIGHKIVCVGYALQNLETGQRESEYENIAIECEDCNEVLVDSEVLIEEENQFRELDLLTSSAETIINSLLDILEQNWDGYSTSDEVMKANDWLKWKNGEDTSDHTVEEICEELTGEKLIN